MGLNEHTAITTSALVEIQRRNDLTSIMFLQYHSIDGVILKTIYRRDESAIFKIFFLMGVV